MSRSELNTASSPTSAASGRYAVPNILQPDDNIMETAFAVTFFWRTRVSPPAGDGHDVGIGGMPLPDNRRKSKTHVPAALPTVMLANLLQHGITSPQKSDRQIMVDSLCSVVETNLVTVEARRSRRRKRAEVE